MATAGSTAAPAPISSWARVAPGGWAAPAQVDCLEDRTPGSAVHGLRAEEVTAILELCETWGEVDRSHRKLAHRGSYLGIVWVSPATVRRVLAAHTAWFCNARGGVIRSQRRPFPEWADYRKNSIYIDDVTHFAGCPQHAVFAVLDLVTRTWITELVSIEETSTQVQVVFHGRARVRGAARARRGPPGRPATRSPLRL
ncbi:MAG: helix-turn-helix domain-containing protein [Solirubrobacteraceae bacterium]